MIATRAQAWAGLAIGGVALVIGLIASRGDDNPADGLKRFNANEARRRVEAKRFDRAVDVPVDDDLPEIEIQVEVTELLVRLDGLEMSNDELEARARILASTGSKITVQLRADANAPYQRLVEVMDLLRDAGLKQIAITATPEP